MSYIPLATVTLGGSDAEIIFSGIPAIFKDLVLILDAKNTVDAQGVRVQFNDDTGNNYSYVVMYGTGSSAASGAVASQGYADFGINRTTTTITKAQILDYAASDKHKTILVRSDNASELTLAYANRWASTSAITKIRVFASANSFTTGSTLNLYGVA